MKRERKVRFIFNEPQIPYQEVSPKQQEFSIITLIGFSLISLFFSKSLPFFLYEFIIPFFFSNYLNKSIYKYFQQIGVPILSELSLLIIPLIILKYFRNKNEIYIIGNSIPNNYLISFLFIFIFFLMSLSLISNEKCKTNKIESLDNFYDFFLYLFSDCFFPSFCEEFFFRGWFFYFLCESLNKNIAVFVTSFVFSLFHFQSFQFWFTYFLTFIFSVCWNFADILTNSIFVSIFSHFFHNFSQTIFLVLFPQICNMPSFCSFAIWLVSCCVLFYLINSLDENNIENIENPDEISFLE